MTVTNAMMETRAWKASTAQRASALPEARLSNATMEIRARMIVAILTAAACLRSLLEPATTETNARKMTNVWRERAPVWRWIVTTATIALTTVARLRRVASMSLSVEIATTETPAR